jgi:hypothetical protein
MAFSAARRNRVKPAVVATCFKRASPACAPRAAPQRAEECDEVVVRARVA